jgi:hypothetical protein
VLPQFVTPPDPNVVPANASFAPPTPPQTLRCAVSELRELVLTIPSATCSSDDGAHRRELQGRILRTRMRFSTVGADTQLQLLPSKESAPLQMEWWKSTDEREARALYEAGVANRAKQGEVLCKLHQCCELWVARARGVYASLRSAADSLRATEHTTAVERGGGRSRPFKISDPLHHPDWKAHMRQLNAQLSATHPLRARMFHYAQLRERADAGMAALAATPGLPAPEACAIAFAPPARLTGSARALCVWMGEASERLAEASARKIYTSHVHELCDLLLSALR